MSEVPLYDPLKNAFARTLAGLFFFFFITLELRLE